MKITVIVPVYNAEPYLHRCLDSLVAQTYADFEAIIVDDGSMDGSREVCDEYAAKEPRFVVLHKVNGGVSTARNAGLDRAHGDYIMFVDADDWIEPDALDLAAKVIRHRQVDAVCMGFVENHDAAERESYHEVIEGGTQVRRWICEIMAGQAAASTHGVNLYAPWAKLYKKDVIESHHLRFDKELKVAQDFWFNLCYFIRCRSIVVDNTVVYHYFQSNGSLVRNCSDVRLRDGVVFMERIGQYLHDTMDGSEAFRRGVHYQLLMTINIAMNTWLVHPANKDSFVKRYKGLRCFLHEPAISYWVKDLSLKDSRNVRDFRDLVLLKCHLFWLRLLTITTKRRMKRFIE